MSPTILQRFLAPLLLYPNITASISIILVLELAPLMLVLQAYWPEAKLHLDQPVIQHILVVLSM